jgi:chromosome segregation ATPase
MKRIILTVLILLLPVYAGAAYNIYLKNGSVINGVSSYQEKGKEVTIYFNTGSMMIPKENILKIEHTESEESEFVPGEEEKVQQKQENTGEVAPPSGSGADRFARIDELRARMDSVNAEIDSAQEREAQLAASINEKMGRRFQYNLIQLKQLERQLEPLRQELTDVRQKKADIVRQRSEIESELRSLGQ